VLAAAYPVGSIYMNVSNSTNPASLLGFGTWSALASGQMLIGNGGGYTAGTTGGSATTTLSTANLPSHSHSISDPGHYHSDNGENSFYGSTSGPDDMQLWAGSHNTGTAFTGITTTNATGSGTAFNTISPYLVVYMWQRTA
jgi:microcystin-dependent protein